MDLNIQFLGATQTVTGSKYLLNIDHQTLLIDCGLFQGLKQDRLRNWEDFPVPPSEISHLILTHAHIDHTGFLPRLYKMGFRGQIHCTQPTKDLMAIMLLDSAKLQEEEAENAARRGYSKHQPPLPLYTEEDAKAVLPLVKAYPLDQKFALDDRISFIFRDSGHILGSASIELFIKGDQQHKKIVFSGDIGRYDVPILYDPEPINEADILIVESTYGNKDNPETSPLDALAKIVNETIERNGSIIIPAFAIGRTQSLIYYFKQLMDQKKIPSLPIYVDSPMAIDVTGIYKKYSNYVKYKDYLEMGMEEIFHFPNVHYSTSGKDTDKLLELKKIILISASGMCTGGRILTHLYHRLRNPHDTVLIVGYQAEGTRGRRLLDGEEEIKIYGEYVPVRCRIEKIDGMSAHADLSELLRWLGNFIAAPKQTFVVHGEKKSCEDFAQTIREQKGWNVKVPAYLEKFELFSGI